MIIGERLKIERINRGLSQEELGKLINVSKVAICGYENGTKNPTMQNFIKLIEVLNLDPNYLLGREVNVVSDSEDEYIVKMSSEDIKIISELKKYPVLYNKFYEDPKRTVELIDRKIK